MIKTLFRKIMVGDQIPNITLPVVHSNSISTVNLSDLTRSKTTVFIGHPGAFTYYTTKQQIPDFETALLPYSIIFWSVNDPFVVKKYAEKYKIPYPMLCDFNGELTRTFETGLDEELFFSFCTRRMICIVKNETILAVTLEKDVQYTNATKPTMVQHLLSIIS